MQDTSTSIPPDTQGLLGAVRSHVRSHAVVVSLAAVLFVALLTRSYIYGAVFRGEAVVFLANDPYYYRFVVERHVAAGGGDLSALLRYEGRDPFLVVALSLVVALAGGVGQTALVLAWYPVVVGVATVALVFVFATLVSSSRLVGVVAAVALALTPAHVVRTALGFSDHHAADFLWLVLGATLLVVCWQAVTIRRRLATALAVAVVLAVQVASWEAGVMLVLPAALAVLAGAVLDVAADRRPRAALDVSASFVGAALLVATAFAWFGWQTPGIVLTFGLLAVCVVASVTALAVLSRVGRAARLPLGVGGVLLAVGTVVVVAAFDKRLAPVRSLFTAGAAFLEGSRGTGIAETVSLVGGPLGPLTGPFSLFGLLLFLALPPLVCSSLTAARTRDVGRAVLVTYTWYFLASALVQRRFAGELSPFVAVFVAFALVDLARRTGVLSGVNSRTPATVTAVGTLSLTSLGALSSTTLRTVRRPGPAAFSVLLALLVVTSSGVLAVKLNQSVATDAEYDAATAIRGYAVDRALTHPESYVLSSLGSNRLFNYEVNADSIPELSYRYAEAHYATFVHSDSPERQYWRHHERVGFVVTSADDVDAASSPASNWVRLHQRLGSRGDGVEGTGHYRLVYASDDDSIRAFALVPGAVVVGQAPPGERVSLSLPVTVGERSFVYTRETTTTAVGWYAITVPYPGTYVVDGRGVTVTEADVLDGRFVATDGHAPSATGAHWSLDANRGEVAFDPVGGFHGRVLGPLWTDEGLSFRGNGGVIVPDGPTPTAETGLAVTVRFTGVDDLSRESPEPARFQRVVSTAPASLYTSTGGYQLGLVDGRIVGAIGDGSGVVDVRGPAVDDSAPHTVSLLWDGQVVRLVVDGAVVDEAPYSGSVTPTDTLVIGATTDDRYPLRAVVTDVRIELIRASEPPDSHR
jgi:dolichyl-diphosphooligosaccharide--protein glycosyltransferase